MDKKLVYVVLVILFIGCIGLGLYTGTVETKVKNLNDDMAKIESNEEKLIQLNKENQELIKTKEDLTKEVEDLKTENQNLKSKVETLELQVNSQV